MTQFLYGTEINLELENIIADAIDHLWFISPYIKLHDRIKNELKNKKEDNDLQIVVVFGKNENDPAKSISIDDINFLKEFPNVLICYEKNLHAKYYANESHSLITSMNLHEFSQNNNIEVAISMTPKSTLKIISDAVVRSTDTGDDAKNYFMEVVKNSEQLFRKEPVFKKGFMNIQKTYSYSVIKEDKLNDFFSNKRFLESYINALTPKTGYCIRTGDIIPFNPSRPYSYDAYKTWVQFSNLDFPEKFCHETGKPSFGKTSMRSPILHKICKTT